MKTKMIIAGLFTVFAMLSFSNEANAHWGRRRGYCRPARVVIAPPILVPRVVVAAPVYRRGGGYYNNGYSCRPRHNHWRGGYGRGWR